MSLLQLYTPRPVNMVRGQMQYLFDSNGNKYLDAGASYGTCNCGHCNPSIANAIQAQSQSLDFVQSTFPSELRTQCASMLANISSLDKVFFTNSGTESVEGAIKFARAATRRTGVIAAMRCFHGRTLGALSATWRKEYRAPFAPLVPGFSHVPFNNLKRLEQTISDNTAAVLLEVVQGDGGVNIATQDYLQGVRELCNDHGTLLILDEVQTGFGRTGRMFAFQHYNIQPDILCLAKSIANSFPMGAIAMTEQVASGIPQHSHGNTFGGNPVACAASIATMNYLQETGLAEHSASLGQYLTSQLQGINRVREVRGLGLMIGLELSELAVPYLHQLVQQGILALPAGRTIIRLLPPLVLNHKDADLIATSLRQVLA